MHRFPCRRVGSLVTVRDAGRYITRLPKAEHEAKEWQAAMESLILVATSGGPAMFARIGVMYESIEPPRRAGVQSGSEGTSLGPPEVEARHVMDSKDAFDLWWEWVQKPSYSTLKISAEIHEAVMALPPEKRRDRAKVNEAYAAVLRPVE